MLLKTLDGSLIFANGITSVPPYFGKDSIPILVFPCGTRKLKFELLYFGKTKIGLV